MQAAAAGLAAAWQKNKRTGETTYSTLARAIPRLAPMLKAELSPQPLHFICELEDQFDAVKIHAARGTEVFDTADNAERVIVKKPTAARGIADRRDQSVFVIKNYQPPGYLGQLRHHLDGVNGPGIRLEDLQRFHRIRIFMAKYGLLLSAHQGTVILITFSSD
jgi:hypothetical protein